MVFNNNLLIYDTSTKGRGVITMKRIKKGAFIMWYEGEFRHQSDKYLNKNKNIDKDNRYNYEAVNGYISVNQPYHSSHYINDCLNNNNFEESKNGLNVIPILQRRLMQNNKYWPCYIASRNIEVGEPLETFYGSSYWGCHHPNLYNNKLLYQIEKYYLLKTIELGYI